MIFLKFSIIDEEIKVEIFKSLINFDISCHSEVENYIKQLMLSLKRKGYNISGFYIVKVYYNESFGLIIKIIKEDDLELFKELVDLKITIYPKSKMFLEIDDYFLIKNYKDIYLANGKYYIDVNLIKEDDLFKLCEFSKVVLEEDFKKIKNKKLIVFQNIV